MNFLLEQLNFLFITKKQRRYSVEMLVMSYIMHATSSKAYERLCQDQIIVEACSTSVSLYEKFALRAAIRKKHSLIGRVKIYSTSNLKYM